MGNRQQSASCQNTDLRSQIFKDASATYFKKMLYFTDNIHSINLCIIQLFNQFFPHVQMDKKQSLKLKQQQEKSKKYLEAVELISQELKKSNFELQEALQTFKQSVPMLEINFQPCFQEMIEGLQEVDFMNFQQHYFDRDQIVGEIYEFDDQIEALNMQKQFKQALRLCELCIQKHGKIPRIMARQSQLLYLSGDYGKVYELDLDLILNEPMYFNNYNNMAANLNKLNKYREAIVYADKAIFLKANYANPHRHKGVALEQIFCFWQASQEFQKALAIKQDYPECIVNSRINKANLRVLYIIEAVDITLYVKIFVRSHILAEIVNYFEI